MKELKPTDISDRLDVVYLIKESGNFDSLELRYSLRSLKNIPHRKVYIVGEKPAWVTNVQFLPVPQDKTKVENWTANLLEAVGTDAISDDFIMMNDDFFIMKSLARIPELNYGEMIDVISDFDQRYPAGSQYINNMKRLYENLVREGNERPISYELHTPMVLNKSRVRELFRRPEDIIPFHFRTLYGNRYKLKGRASHDFKIYKDSIHNDQKYTTDPIGYMSMQPFLSVTGGSFKNHIIGNFLESQFSEKSIYEL